MDSRSPGAIQQGRAVRHTRGSIRKAYCKTAAGAASTIVCYLDTDGTGTEVTVYCTIAGGGYLNAAYPRLTDGLMMPVWNDGEYWRSLWGFQAADEDCE